MHHTPFLADEMPGLTHGICPGCYAVFIDVLEELKEQRSRRHGNDKEGPLLQDCSLSDE